MRYNIYVTIEETDDRGDTVFNDEQFSQSFASLEEAMAASNLAMAAIDKAKKEKDLES